MKKYARAIEVIKRHEGYERHPYMDPVGVWTIGYGHVLRDRKGMLRGREREADAKAMFPHGVSPSRAERILYDDMRPAIKAVKELVKVPLKNTQLNALVSWTFNLGVGALKRSTLLKRLNAKDYDTVPDEMKKWNKAGGVVMAGLVRRRSDEAELFDCVA